MKNNGLSTVGYATLVPTYIGEVSCTTSTTSFKYKYARDLQVLA